MKLSTKNWYTLPEQITNVPLNYNKSSFSLVVPQAAYNFIANPEFKDGITNYATYGTSQLTLSTLRQTGSTQSLFVDVINNGGVYYTHSPIDSVVPFESLEASFSFDLMAREPQGITVFVTDAQGQILSRKTFMAREFWNRYYIQFPVEVPNPQLEFYITSTTNFWIDSLHLYEGTYNSTYVGFDVPGIVVQNSLPYRPLNTRCGGKVVNFKDLQVYITDISGNRTLPKNLQTIDRAVYDGATFVGSRKTTRTLNINGVAYNCSVGDALACLIEAMSLYDMYAEEHMLIYQPLDDCDEVTCPPVYIKAAHSRGPEGSTQTTLSESWAMQFIAHDPYWYRFGTRAQELISLENVDFQYVAQRNELGEWYSPGGGITVGFQPNKIVAGELGNDFYMAGNFSNVGGLPTGPVAYWDGTQWLDIGASNLFTNDATPVEIFDMAFGPENRYLYMVGNFDTYAPLFPVSTDVNNIVRYDTQTGLWEAVGNGLDAEPKVIDIYENTAYIGGENGLITGFGPVAQVDLTTQLYQPVGGESETDSTGNVTAIKRTPNYLYIGGTFDLIDAIDMSAVARYTFVGNVWDSMNGGLLTGDQFLPFHIVNAIESSGTGVDDVYFGGGFGTDATGTTDFNNIALWKDGTFYTLGAGVDGLFAIVNDIQLLDDTTIVVGGTNWDTVDTLNIDDNLAYWNGSRWTRGDLDLPGGDTGITTIAKSNQFIGAQNTAIHNTAYLTLGFTSEGTGSSVSRAVEICNFGTHNSTAKFEFTGPLTLNSITNQLGQYIAFNNFTLQAEQKAFLDLSGDNISFTWNEGNLLNELDLTGFPFQLNPGTNSLTLSFESDEIDLNTTSILMYWQERHENYSSACKYGCERCGHACGTEFIDLNTDFCILPNEPVYTGPTGTIDPIDCDDPQAAVYQEPNNNGFIDPF